MSSARVRTLVTGGAGFVGGHLVESLVALDHEVLVIDNFFAGRREHVPGSVGLVEMDLGTVDEQKLARTLHDFGPDQVVHLAAIHHIPYCLSHPGHTFQSNVRGTDVLIRALQGSLPCRLVLASTGDVYANTDAPHSETDVTEPGNPYGLSKLLDEQLTAYGVRTNDQLSAVVLRLFNIYGTRETNSHVIPRILELLKDTGQPEIRMGYLGGTRDFVHVSDVVKAILKALLHQGERFDVFNIGTGVPSSVRKVLEILKNSVGDERPVIEDAEQFRPFERKSLTPVIDKAVKKLGWSPSIDIVSGLEGLAAAELGSVTVHSRS